MPSDLIVVDGCVPTHLDDTNLLNEVWSFALDQRAFGPRKLWVAFADCDGTFRGLAYTERAEPLDARFEACLAYLGTGAAVAVAFCDEVVRAGPRPPELVDRLANMRQIAARYEICLVDWISCDADRFRSVDGAVPFPQSRK